MDEENISDVKEIETCFHTNHSAKSEESCVEAVPVVDVGNAEECTSEINEVAKPKGGNLRRHSTGAIGTKSQVKSRYRGDHHVSSTHDFCKHGKRCDRDNAVKPWNMVRRKSVEGSEAVKVETSGSRRESLGMITKLQSSVDAKRNALCVKRKPCGSVNSESSSVKEDSEMARSVDGSSVISNDKTLKKRETQNVMSGSALVRKVPGLRNERNDIGIEKVSRISDGKSSKLCALKNLKNKEKAKTQTISGEDVKEKTVCVIESSIKGVLIGNQPSSEKKTMNATKHGFVDHSSTKQIPGKISTGLTKKKENGSSEVEANPKPEKKIRPKKTGVRVTLAKQLSFKRGKVLEPKPEDSSPIWIKFRRRVVQEQKTQTEGSKKNLKDKRLGYETITDSCEGSLCEKVVLRHQNLEGQKKMITLFNNVIEETMSKFTKARKNKVEALVGAFETVISLQNTKTSQKVQRKATTSASKVSPFVSEQ